MAAVQLFDADDKRISSVPFRYSVTGDLSIGRQPTSHERTILEIVVQDGPQLISDMRTVLANNELFKQEVNEKVEQAQTDANEAKQITAQLLDDSFDTGALNTNIEQRLNDLETEYAPQLTNLTQQFSESKSKTVTLQHGQNIIESDIPSSIKVEFYGNTLVNGFGEDGNFEEWLTTATDASNPKGWNVMHPTLFKRNRITGSKGSYAYSFTGSYTDQNTSKTLSFNEGDNVLIVFKYKSDSSYGLPHKLTISFGASASGYNDTNKQVVKTDGDNNWKFGYLKTTFSVSLPVLRIAAGSGSSSQSAIDELAIFKISSDTYNKIGVSLTDQQVADMFNYVDSVQHVKHPIMKVSGSQLIDNFYSWSDPDYAVSPYHYQRNDVASSYINDYTLELAKGQTYTISAEIAKGYLYVRNAGTTTVLAALNSGITEVSFTMPSDVDKITVSLARKDSVDNDIDIKNIILNLGSTPKPFVPKNDSYLYAQTTLAGNDNKKDILRKNEALNRWEKTKWFEFDNNFDLMNWGLLNINDTYSRIRCVANTPYPSNAYLIATKYNGMPLTEKTANIMDAHDQADIYSNGDFYLTIANSDSGWLGSMTNLSKDLIKSYFYGYRYFGDGTNHKWRPIGDTDATRETTVLPTSPAPTIAEGKIDHYKLTYQLAKPVIEVEGIDFPYVEGDLSIQGSSQVDCSAGVIVREKIVPVTSNETQYFHFNNISLGSNVPNNPLKNKVLRVISIYKNGEENISKWTKSPILAYGSERWYIPKTDLDLTKDEITVTYELLDKHAFTTNIQEVKATFSSSIKSSFSRMVEKQSDIATEQTIQARQIYNMLVRLKALEG